MKKSLFLLLTIFWGFLSVQAQDIPAPMSPKRTVNDFANILNPSQRNELEKYLVAFNDSTSTQITVVTVKDLGGYPAVDFAQRLGEKWGVGQKGKDNGVVILVKPKTGMERGEAAIAVGYGLEGVLPDAVASRIVRNEMIPEFKNNQYYRGIAKAVLVVSDITRGEYTADQYTKKSGATSDVPLGIFIPLVLIFIVPLFFRRRRGFTTGSTAHGVPPIFFGGFGSSGNSFGSFNSGTGNFGGFGGFGGGSFGGGGAGGSW